MFYLTLFCLFIFGLILGSFFNVVIYRQFLGEDWVKGRSRCDYCKTKISWFDNIPLFSFLILGGRCRHCHRKISFTHPLMELLTASLLVWWYLCVSFFFALPHPFLVIQATFWLLVGLVLLAIFVIDLKYMFIPDALTIMLLILSIVYRFFLCCNGLMNWLDFGKAVVASSILTLFFYSLYFFTKKKGFGFGDVKLAFPLGLLLGWPKIVIGIYMAFISGSLVGIATVFLKKKKFKNQRLPFAPFLIFGLLFGLIFGERLFYFLF
jgi:leader peptidase (prepilin peptidase)/N-methyltransferase